MIWLNVPADVPASSNVPPPPTARPLKIGAGIDDEPVRRAIDGEIDRIRAAGDGPGIGHCASVSGNIDATGSGRRSGGDGAVIRHQFRARRSWEIGEIHAIIVALQQRGRAVGAIDDRSAHREIGACLRAMHGAVVLQRARKIGEEDGGGACPGSRVDAGHRAADLVDQRAAAEEPDAVVERRGQLAVIARPCRRSDRCRPRPRRR